MEREIIERDISVEREYFVGGGQTDVFILRWVSGPIDKNNLTPEQQTDIEYNLGILDQIFSSEPGNYIVYINRGRLIAVDNVLSLQSQGVIAIDLYENELLHVLQIGGTTIANYQQADTLIPELVFDETSDAAAAMSAIAEYINDRCGTNGDIATKSEVNEKYTLPSGGIPKTDLSQSVQNSLDAGDSASAGLSGVLALIPAQASSTNKLADKDFVNSSVATNTAYFIGTFDSVAELEAYSGTLTNNDYAFVIVYDPVEPTEVNAYDRYKYNASTEEWIFEYELNNSSFTSAQWAAINSAITASKVTAYDAHVADSTIHVTAQNKTTWNAKYDKPSAGIPKSDLAQDVQTSLGKADTALQSVPVASAQTLGGVKVGTNLSIDANGVMSATDTTYTEGTGISINNGVISVSYPDGDSIAYGGNS